MSDRRVLRGALVLMIAAGGIGSAIASSRGRVVGVGQILIGAWRSTGNAILQLDSDVKQGVGTAVDFTNEAYPPDADDEAFFRQSDVSALMGGAANLQAFNLECGIKEGESQRLTHIVFWSQDYWEGEKQTFQCGGSSNGGPGVFETSGTVTGSPQSFCLITSVTGSTRRSRCLDGPRCDDQRRNGTESDVDCGGSCSKCDVGRECDFGSDCQSGVCLGTTCRAFAFRVAAPAAAVELAPGATADATIQIQRSPGFVDAVVVTPLALPAGISISPSTRTVTGSSASFSLAAAPSVPAGAFGVTFRGSSGAYPPHESTLTVHVAKPGVTSVSPGSGPRGSPVTIAGSNFSAVCGDNVVRIGGQTAAVGGCSPTSITAIVPDLAAYGDGQVVVTRAGLASNATPFRVTRIAGDFVDITYEVLQSSSSGRSCSDGEVRLDITGTYTARYVRVADGAIIGTREFDRDSPPLDHPRTDYTVTPSNIGGAGFSTCEAGIVFDADAEAACTAPMAFKFLKLTAGPPLPSTYCVEYFSAQQGLNSFEGNFRVYRSPDGTVIAIMSPVSTLYGYRVGLVDVPSGQVFRRFDMDEPNLGSRFAISAADRVTLVAGSKTWGPYDVPD